MVQRRLYIGILTIILPLLILTGCSINFNNDDQSEKITQLEQQINELQKKIDEQQASTSKKDESTDNENVENDTENVTSSIQITDPKDGAIIYEEPFYITGETSADCSKIVATAKNEEYKINNVYTLQNYKYGDTTFKYGIKHDWNNLDVGKNIYSFAATCDGGNRAASIQIYFEAGGGVEMGKPVIYLYPEQEQEVFVLPEPEGGVTISQPALNNGWNITAYPNGDIIDQAGIKWPYLFWEGYSDITTPEEGFLVDHSELNSFFDEKLAFLGLIPNEIKDFKEYWLKQLNEEKYYLISFIPQSEIDEHAPILVEPKPDTVIRVFFDYKTLDAPFGYSEQILEKGPERNGFTMIEWGGRLY